MWKQRTMQFQLTCLVHLARISAPWRLLLPIILVCFSLSLYSVAYHFAADVTSAPSPTMLQFLSMHASDVDEQKEIYSYSSDYGAFSRLHYTILGMPPIPATHSSFFDIQKSDMLVLFPSISLVKDDAQKNAENLAVLLGLLGPIKPRHYSIANSPSVFPNLIRIIYKVPKYQFTRRVYVFILLYR
jgi:sulfite reductase alpha subunit-like flavoprotein